MLFRGAQREGESPSPTDNTLANTISPIEKRRGSLFIYLSTVLSSLVLKVSRKQKEKDQQCALCPDLILSTQPADEDEGDAPVHAMCLEMKLKKESLLKSVRARDRACPLCGHRIKPQDYYLHEGGLTMSYACTQPEHGESYPFSFLLETNESRWIGMWEARLRQRLKEKGYVSCCECGRRIRQKKAQTLGSGWHYCGCLPELWHVGP